jgi:hypothetical protein
LNFLKCVRLDSDDFSFSFSNFDRILCCDTAELIHKVNLLLKNYYLLVVVSLGYDLKTRSPNSQPIILKVRLLINASQPNKDEPMLKLLLFAFKDRKSLIFLTNLLLMGQRTQTVLKSPFHFSCF